MYKYSNNIDLGNILGHDLGCIDIDVSNINSFCLINERICDLGHNIENCYSKKDNINNNKISNCVVAYLNKKY